MVSGSEFTSTCRRGNDRSSAGLLIGAPPHGMHTADHRTARATGPNFSAHGHPLVFDSADPVLRMLSAISCSRFHRDRGRGRSDPIRSRKLCP